MTTALIATLGDYIKTQNTYFDNGYYNAFKDGGVIYAVENGNLRIVFPLDTKGSYFYMRVNGDINHNASEANRITDCGVGRLAFNYTQPMVLVAVVKKADEYKLHNNIFNTLMQFTTFDAIPQSSSLIAEDVVRTEMQGALAGDIEAALQRLKDETIIRINFNINGIYIADNCIVDPCKDC